MKASTAEREAYQRERQAAKAAEIATTEHAMLPKPAQRDYVMRGAYSRGNSVGRNWWRMHPGAKFVPASASIGASK